MQKTSIDVDLDEDRITLRYDAARVTTAQMQQAVSKHGFEAKIVAGPTPVE